jgi:acyl-CoA synthetase (AMP-forming)/AMP-acid ligase II
MHLHPSSRAVQEEGKGIKCRLDVEIVDGGRKPVPIGATGEIRVRRRTEMQSVWRSAGAGGDGWIYPGQRGRRLPDGLLAVGG